MITTGRDPIAYGITEACATLGIRRTKLYDLIGQGRIRAKTCGRRTLIDAESLKDFFAALPEAQIGRQEAHNSISSVAHAE